MTMDKTQANKIAEKHMQQMLDLDAKYATGLRKTDKATVAGLIAVIAYFTMKIDKTDNLSEYMQKAPNQADISEFKAFLDELPDNLTADVKKRIKLYKQMATLDRQHMANAMAGVFMMNETLKRQKALNDNLLKDYANEISRQGSLLRQSIQAQKAQAVVDKPSFGEQWQSRLLVHADKATRLVNNEIDRQVHGKVDRDKLQTVFGKVVEQYDNATINLQTSESARVIGDAELDAYSQLGIKKIWFNALPDACQICLDASRNSPYTLDNVPPIPLHGHCRCEYSSTEF